jgi:hypothetical protein
MNTPPMANNPTVSNRWAIDGLSSGDCDYSGNSTDKLSFQVG